MDGCTLCYNAMIQWIKDCINVYLYVLNQSDSWGCLTSNGAHTAVELWKCSWSFSFNHTLVFIHSLFSAPYSLSPPLCFCLTHIHTHVHIRVFTLLESHTLNATLTPFCHSSPSGVNAVTLQHADWRIITDTQPEPGTAHNMTPSYSPLESHVTTST